jgi:hypothetical protein
VKQIVWGAACITTAAAHSMRAYEGETALWFPAIVFAFGFVAALQDWWVSQ